VNERAREPVRVDQAPSRCPFCHGAFESVRDLVACAACGARHHAECYAQNKKCATCGSSDVLVPPLRAAVAPPTPTAAEVAPQPPRSVLDAPGLTPGEVFLVIALTLPLGLVGALVDRAFFPPGSPHAAAGGQVIAAIVILVPTLTVLVRRFRRRRA